MSKRIAIVYSAGRGSPQVASQKLSLGLRSDGYFVDSIVYDGKHFWNRRAQDILATRGLSNYDTVIYGNSTSQLSGIPRFGSAKALFVHGFMFQELVNSIEHGNPANRISKLAVFGVDNILRILNGFNVLIYRSQTSAETNHYAGRAVILPQFVLQDELSNAASIRETRTGDDVFRIVAYTSGVRSPRLLPRMDLLEIGSRLAKLVRKEFQFLLIDPLGDTESPSQKVRIIGRQPRDRFLSLIGSSDLYIERCVDEELSESTIEAGLMGTSIAKVTLPKYHERRDYTEEDMIAADTLSDLVTQISDFINNVGVDKASLNNNFLRFLKRRRNWITAGTALRAALG